MRARAPAEPLEDGVVILRAWRSEDVDAIVAACSDAETAAWIHALPQPYTRADAEAYLAAVAAAAAAGRGAGFAIVVGDAVAGSIELRVVDSDHAVGEIGYWAAPAVRGLGLTTRALRLLSRWAIRDLGAQRLQIRADVENVPSRRVAENAGFTYEGVLRSSGFNPRRGRRIDYAVYSLLPGEES